MIDQSLINRQQPGRPLRVMFITTRMCVGGEEILLVELIRRLNRERFSPELCCLKFLGELGEVLSQEIPVTTDLLTHKFDFRVLGRLTRLLRDRQIDAVVTVGTGGDRMFWGRLAARRAGVPVIVSAIHSMGFPIRVEWLNRRLEPMTDAFIATTTRHGTHLVQHEGCPAGKVHVIPNGTDTDRFRPLSPDPALQAELGLPPGAPVVGVVAEMRPEKNLSLWLHAAAAIRAAIPNAHFLLVGGGDEREMLSARARELGIADAVHFAGRRRDVPQLLALMDLFMLSSVMEANPVSILEAMACGKPVVATRVGAIADNVVEGHTGFLVQPGNHQALAQSAVRLLTDAALAQRAGAACRMRIVERCSVQHMVVGYEDLIESLFLAKRGPAAVDGRPSHSAVVSDHAPWPMGVGRTPVAVESSR